MQKDADVVEDIVLHPLLRCKGFIRKNIRIRIQMHHFLILFS